MAVNLKTAKALGLRCLLPPAADMAPLGPGPRWANCGLTRCKINRTPPYVSAGNRCNFDPSCKRDLP
jgi:hypothetical protein